MIRRLFLASIWAPGAIPEEEGPLARDLKRVILPLFDFYMVCSGWFGYQYVVPALSERLPHHVIDPLCALFAGAALVCLVGVSFPRLWRVEQGGKAVMFGLLVGFLIVLATIIFDPQDTQGPGADSRWYFVPFIAHAITMCVWSMKRLTREERTRRAKANLLQSGATPE